MYKTQQTKGKHNIQNKYLIVKFLAIVSCELHANPLLCV
jgi:hypothetical protein